MSQKKFGLQWDNHAENLVQVFADQFEREQHVDVTISCQGRFIKVHKFVLGACSPYFQEMLDAQEESAYPMIIMEGYNFDDVRSIVEFMYKGKLTVAETGVQRLLQTAEDLQIRGLSNVRNKLDSQQESRYGSEREQYAPQHTNIENGALYLQGSCRSDVIGGSGGQQPQQNSFATPSLVIGAENSIVGGNNNEGRPTQNKRNWKRAMMMSYDAEMKRNPGGIYNKFCQQAQDQTGTNPEDSAARLDQSTNSNMPISIAPRLVHGQVDGLKHENSSNAVIEHILLPVPNVVKCWPETEVKKKRIPRPTNSFMIFGSEWRRQLAGQFPNESNKEISVRLGIMWRSLTKEAKAKYFIAARNASDDHKKKYPHYHYSPKEARLRKLWKLQSKPSYFSGTDNHH